MEKFYIIWRDAKDISAYIFHCTLDLHTKPSSGYLFLPKSLQELQFVENSNWENQATKFSEKVCYILNIRRGSK